MTALDVQVDGTHYTSMKVQPIELSYGTLATPCFTKVSKYTTRKKDEPLVQMEKALHIVQLEATLEERGFVYPILLSESKSAEMVCQFTDDQVLRYALQAMYHRRHEEATHYLEILQEQMQNE